MIDTVKNKNKELLSLYNDYTMANNILEASIVMHKRETEEKDAIKAQIDEINNNISIFLPHFDVYINNDLIRSRLQKNSIDLITKNDTKFDPSNGYDEMSVEEKY